MKLKNMMNLFSVAGLLLAFVISGCAPVTITSKPEDAKVYYKHNEAYIGTTPLKVNLIANGKQIVVRKDGYFSKTVTVSPIDPENILVELKPRDRVILLSVPTGAELFVEDVGRVGRTPYRIDYKKSYRTFTVKAPGYASIDYTIPEDPEGDIVIDLERDKSVMVTSKPKRCEIFSKEGKHLGTTPLAVPAVDKRQIEIRKDGYYPKEVSIDEETVSPFLVELEREPIIIVYSDPEGATVMHRGVTLGKTPYRQLVKEDMDLEVSFNRFYTKEITVGPDSPREVTVPLDPKPYVIIMSDPAEAQLYRSGGVELLGSTPIEVLIEKDMSFEVHKSGYNIKQFTLSPESNRKVIVPLKRSTETTGKVVLIDSEPSGAKVYRPGGAEFIGETPLEQHVRTERSFELQLEGYKTKIVTVAPDSSDSVVFALVRDESAGNVTVSDPLLNTPSSF